MTKPPMSMILESQSLYPPHSPKSIMRPMRCLEIFSQGYRTLIDGRLFNTPLRKYELITADLRFLETLIRLLLRTERLMVNIKLVWPRI